MFRRMKRAALWFGATLAVLVALLGVAAALAVYRPGMLRPLAERLLRPPGGTSSLDGLEVGVRPPFLILRGLEIRWGESGDRLGVERLRAVPIPARVFGAGPWLRELEVEGLEVRRSARGDETAGPPDLSPLSWLFAVETLSVRGARLDLGAGDTRLTLDGLALSLAPTATAGRALTLRGEVGLGKPDGRRTRGELRGAGEVTPGPALALHLFLAVPGLEVDALQGDLRANADLDLSPERLEVGQLELALAGARVGPTSGHGWELGASRATLAGGVGLDGSDPRFEVSRLEVGDLLRGRGSISGRTFTELAGHLDGTLPELGRLRPGFAPLLPAELQDLNLRGQLPFQLEVTASARGASLALGLQTQDVTLSWPHRGLAARLGGTLRVATPPGEPVEDWAAATLAGRLEILADVATPPLAARSVRLVLPLSGSLSGLRSPEASLSADAGKVLWEGRVLPLGAVTAQGSLAADRAAVRVDALRVEAETLGHLTGEITLGEGVRKGRLAGKALRLRSLAEIARAVTQLPGQTWPTEGSVDLAARVEPAEGGEIARADFRLHGAGCSSPDGEFLAQGLGGDLTAEWRTGPGRAPRLAGELSLDQGEALWGTVYLNLSRSPLHLRTGATLRGGALETATAEARLQGYARLNLTGDLRRERGRWRHRGRLVVEEANLEPLFQTFVRDPLAASSPGLAGLQAGGTGRLDLEFAGLGPDADLRGHLEVRAGRLAAKGEPALVSGVALDLPLGYFLGPTRAAAAPPEAVDWGRLRLDGLAAAGVALGPLDLPVALVPNRLYLGGTVTVPLFGGRLLLSDIRVEEPLSEAFRATLGARLEGLDLGRIPLDELPLKGRLEGDLGPVTIQARELAAAGSLAGELFHGHVEAHGLAVRRPFTVGREFAGDFQATDMDLERLSEALDVGRVTGRVSASLSGLRVAYGQPVAFHLRVASVPTKGVEQRVSLKAVNSISLLATGSALGGAGLSFLTSLFRQFPYDRIGFACNLENDVFTVRGLIREDGVEYLVKRPFFGGINVINQNPDNRIRFSDMVRRLRRLAQQDPGPEPRP